MCRFFCCFGYFGLIFFFFEINVDYYYCYCCCCFCCCCCFVADRVDIVVAPLFDLELTDNFVGTPLDEGAPASLFLLVLSAVYKKFLNLIIFKNSNKTFRFLSYPEKEVKSYQFSNLFIPKTGLVSILMSFKGLLVILEQFKGKMNF